MHRYRRKDSRKTCHANMHSQIILRKTRLRYTGGMLAETVHQIAAECGFELAGVAAAEPIAEDIAKYDAWAEAGYAGEMGYLTDRRRQVRRHPRNLLESARSVICVGKLYNTGEREPDPGEARIARYAQGRDYHDTMRARLQQMVARMQESEPAPFDTKICVDTAPLLERSYARRAGLGWIGKNTCLINQEKGSWFLLGEILTSLEIVPSMPPPDRCGTCTRCIDACPTDAIIPAQGANGNEWTLDSRLCISYLTIELRSEIPEPLQEGIGNHVFGCDICQQVCPWNRDAPVTQDSDYHGKPVALDQLAAMDEAEFRDRFHGTPLWRSRLTGMQRNVNIVRRNLLATKSPPGEPLS